MQDLHQREWRNGVLLRYQTCESVGTEKEVTKYLDFSGKPTKSAGVKLPWSRYIELTQSVQIEKSI